MADGWILYRRDTKAFEFQHFVCLLSVQCSIDEFEIVAISIGIAADTIFTVYA